MDDELVLHPSPVRWLGLLVASVAFVAAGIWIVSRGDAPRWAGWTSIFFFGLGVPVSLFQFLPGACELRIDREGFTIRQMYRSHRVLWSELTEIGVGGPRGKMVVFNYAPGKTKGRRLRSMARALSGSEGGLPDTYGMRAEELAWLLEDRRRAGAEGGPPPAARR
jgi:hypothetical protein